MAETRITTDEELIALALEIEADAPVLSGGCAIARAADLAHRLRTANSRIGELERERDAAEAVMLSLAPVVQGKGIGLIVTGDLSPRQQEIIAAARDRARQGKKPWLTP